MSFESRMERVKSVPNKYRLTVFGFVREMESVFYKINNSAYYNIPDLVSLTILCFYYNFIQFTTWGDGVAVSGEENNILTLGFSANRSALIGDPINSMDDKVIRCKIKLTKLHSYMLFFGICSDADNLNLNSWFYLIKAPYLYCIQNSGHRFKNDKDKNIQRVCDSYYGVSCYGPSAELTLILDLEQSTISFERDGESAGICYDDVVRKEGLSYRIGVGIYEGESMEILDYSEYSSK